LEQALHGGEDYELLFTAPPGAKVPRSIAGVAVTRIGSIRRDPKQLMLLRTPDGAEMLLPVEGWEHFR
jgi:thiamine-monophosphate kinase